MQSVMYGFAAILAAVLLAGCETEPTQISEKLPPPPSLSLGAEFEVLKAPRYGYFAEGTTDPQGRAHLIVLLRKKEVRTASASATAAEREALRHESVMEVRHYVIGPQGVISSEVIRRVKEEPVSLDLAFDRAGQLHALIGGEHLIYRNGVWVGGQRTPWQQAGLTTSSAHFVKGATDLTWVFLVPGSAMGIPAISDWTVVTGGGGIAPYHRTIDISRTVVVREQTPYRRWSVMNMDTDDGSDMVFVAADRRQAVHALYARQTISAIWDLRYEAFHPDGACPEPNPRAWFAKLALRLPDGTPVCPVLGSPFSAGNPYYTLMPTQNIGPQIQVPEPVAHLVAEIDNMDFAMDAESGAVLMAGVDGKSMLVGDAGQSAEWSDMPIKSAGILLEPAGGGRFHALATALDDFRGTLPVYYMEYSAGGWSAPVQVGNYANPFFRGHESSPAQPRQDEFRLITGQDGRMLLVWPHDDALVARWATLK